MTHSTGFNRRDVLGTLAGAAAGSLVGPMTGAAQPMPGGGVGGGSTATGSRPNLILYFIDECRADALGTYGNPVCKTPNFDILARQGTMFADCHVQFPVCGASRCSLLTGLPPSETGHRSLYYFIRRDEPNLFRYLKEAGYDTYWFGKNDAFAPESFPLSLTEWHDLPWRMPRMKPGAGKPPWLTGEPLTMRFEATLDRRETTDYLLLQRAIAILERREKDRPFCMFLPLVQPHPPYLAPDGFDTLYRPQDLPPLAPSDLAGKPDYHAAIRKAYHLDKATDLEFRKVRATYYGQVSYADWLLGQLLEALDRTGHTKDTVLIAGSDHGDYAGDYGLIEKWPSGLETCLTHVPLVARMPGGASGHVVNEMVELYDIMATFLDLGEVTPRHTFFARSLVPQLKGAKGDPGRAAFTESGYDTFEPQAFEPSEPGAPNMYSAKHDLQNQHPETVTRAASIATPEYKYIARPGGQSELYDRRKDPLETRNLIDSRSHAKVREGLQLRLMNRYISTTGVPPMDRDGREMPEFEPMSTFSPEQKQRTRTVLDQ